MSIIQKKDVKQRITRKRIEIEEEKSAAGKLGEETVAVNPEDIICMFAGKSAIIFMDGQKRLANTLFAYKKSYGSIPEEYKMQMEEIMKSYEQNFDSTKKMVIKIAEAHPLWQRFSGISGFTAYQLALLMSYIKDIKRFHTPSALCVYAGVSQYDNMAIVKANINKIKEEYLKEGKEFKGFNTAMAGRMYVIAECLLRAKGSFYVLYTQMRKRLHARVMNNNECEPDKEGSERMIMKGKKNQSVDVFTHATAMRKIEKILLHLIHTEWTRLEGLEDRIPYPIEYLGHKKLITLDEMLEKDMRIREAKKVERAEAKKAKPAVESKKKKK